MFQFDEPFGSSIFCDDIRNEIGGKNSYMGVYPGSLGVPAFPFVVPKFGVATTIYEPTAMAQVRDWGFPVRVFLPGDDPEQPTLTAEIPPVPREAFEMLDRSRLPEDEEVPKLMILTAGFVLAPLTLRQPGRIKVRATYKEGMVLKLGTCRVELVQAQTSLATPST
jgi:hypothetical protein